jgi:hypothetical protein
MLKALCTAATGPFVRLLEISLPTFEAYGRRHGWEIVVDSEDRANGRPVSWGSVPLIAELLLRYDLVMWIDADAMIVDDSVDLASELRPLKELYLVEHRHAPTGEVTVNAGILMIRAGRWAERFLAAVWAQEDLINHRWWENAAIMRLLGYRIDPQPASRDRRTRWSWRMRVLDVQWNSMPHWHGSLTPRIVHYAGLPLEERLTQMRALSAEFDPISSEGKGVLADRKNPLD